MLADLKFALRQLRKSPGFTLTAVLTLALGIGATTAIFSMFDQVLLRMLPVHDPQQLVRMDWHGSFNGSMSDFGGDVGSYYSYPMYVDLRDKNQVFSGMLATVETDFGVSWHNQAADTNGELVSGNYFQVLGLHPALGRLFTQADETAKDANPVAVLSYDYWRSRMAAQRSVIGQPLLINGHPFTIVGVAPPNFHTAIGGFRPDVFLPVTMVDIADPSDAQQHRLTNRRSIWLTIVARRKPGVSIAQAQAAISPLWHALRAQELTLYKSTTPTFRERYVQQATIRVLDDSTGFSPNRADLKTPLIILLSMAGLLLAICTLNVATLLLLRSAARVREMTMRYALGARSSRIVRQLLLEGGLLGLFGASLGLAFSPLLTRILVRLLTQTAAGAELPYSANIDGRVLLFGVGIALLVSVFFSIAPALHFLHPDLTGALRQSTGTASKSTQRFRKAAVGVQIALSVLLLGGAGLFVRTLNHLRDQPVGFSTRHLVTFSFEPTLSGYSTDRTHQSVEAAIDAARRIPGVQDAAATTDPELSGQMEYDGVSIQGYKFAPGEREQIESPWITPGYFATLRQPLLLGRSFTRADAQGAPKVAIVNLAFAKRYFGSAQKALGHLVGSPNKLDTTIIGVVGNVRHYDLRTEIGPGIYRPYLQLDHPVDVQMYVRTSMVPQSAETAISQAMHKLDPLIVVGGMRTMEAQVDLSAADERVLAMLAAAFAVLAAMLAALGLYGVLAYAAQSRTREIGVRLALGAPRSALVSLVVREMAWIAAAAILAAIPAVVGLAHFFRSQLYGVATWDPVTLLSAVALTLLMTFLAAVLPARRATEVDPMIALRTE